MGITLLDLAQTRWFIKHPRCNVVRYVRTCDQETDVAGALTNHPTVGRADNLIVASIVAHAAIAYWLPHGPLRDGWQYVWIGIEGSAVYGNHKKGVKTDFGLRIQF